MRKLFFVVAVVCMAISVIEAQMDRRQQRGRGRREHEQGGAAGGGAGVGGAEGGGAERGDAARGGAGAGGAEGGGAVGGDVGGGGGGAAAEQQEQDEMFRGLLRELADLNRRRMAHHADQRQRFLQVEQMLEGIPEEHERLLQLQRAMENVRRRMDWENRRKG